MQTKTRYLLYVYLISLFIPGMIVSFTGCNRPLSPEPVLFHNCNLIMISLDTLRQDRLGIYGYPVNVSPFLDNFSPDSTVFTDVMAQSAHTVISHRAIFTSQYLLDFEKRKPIAKETLAGIMSENGWKTAAFVDAGRMHSKMGNNAGFKLYDDEGGGFDAILPKAQTWLSQNSDQKFFLFLHTYDIHHPYDPPQPYSEIFQDDYKPDGDPIQRKAPSILNRMDLSENDYTYLSNLYDGEIRRTDFNLNQFFNHLQISGTLPENTIIVILSDHGESLGERHYLGHQQLYNVQLKIPVLIAFPGTPGKLIDGPLESIDLMPTLLHLFGLEIPYGAMGRNLLTNIFHNRKLPLQRNRISEQNGKAIQTETGWKLILRPNPENDEFYDMTGDPEEVQNRLNQNREDMEKLRNDFIHSTGHSSESLREPLEIKSYIGLDHLIAKPQDQKLNDQLKKLGYIE